MKYLKTHSLAASVLLKLFIVCALMFPVYFTSVDSPYYPEIIVSNILLVLSCILIFFTLDKTKNNRIFILLSGCFLIMYNIFFVYYMTLKGQWAYDNINVTLAMVSFFLLLACSTDHFFEKHHVIQFLMAVILITTLIGILVFHLGYTSVSFLNGQITFTPLDPNYYETRYSWFYFHKSQYCFMLLLFIALFVTYRKLFPNRVTYYLSLVVLLYAIYISHTYTALFASLLIFAGCIMDYIRPRLSRIKKRYFLLLIPPVLIAAYFVYRMSRERNIWNLGGRLNIWKESINQILEFNEGVGDLFGGISFEVPGLSFEVYNCHNFFLNIMYRFSLPAGICFAVMFLLIIIFSLRKRFCFLTAGIWTALLISLGMDYALLTTDLPITMFMLYCLFFHPEKAVQHKTISQGSHQ